MSDMIAKHQIVRAVKGKRVTVMPGEPLDVSGDELEDLKAAGAVREPRKGEITAAKQVAKEQKSSKKTSSAAGKTEAKSDDSGKTEGGKDSDSSQKKSDGDDLV